MESLRFISWKYFSLGWWNALSSAWFPDVRHFENLTPWIQLRIGLRDRVWKPTNGHSRKLAQLSMAIFSKFWSRDHYPICIHGSRSRCFTCIAEQVTSGSCWHEFSGRAGLSFREHKRRNGEICPGPIQIWPSCCFFVPSAARVRFQNRLKSWGGCATKMLRTEIIELLNASNKSTHVLCIDRKLRSFWVEWRSYHICRCSCSASKAMFY